MTSEGGLVLTWVGLGAAGLAPAIRGGAAPELECPPADVRREGAIASCHGTAPLAARQRLVLGLPVDLNDAEEEDLIGLPGIGPVLARRIVEHRQRVGRFQTVADVGRVPGIGPAHLKALLGKISVEERVVP
jgi:competence protein ComEA